MKFRELMDKYEKGIASEEEKILIEQEIEKYEAIEEYIAGNIDMDFMSHGISDEQMVETIKIKKTVNSRLRKVVLTSVIAVMLIVFGIFFIISPIIDSLYYNPSDVTVGESETDINFDLYAFTELNLPGYVLTSNINAESLGFSKYDIYFYRKNLYTQENNEISFKIKQGNSISSYNDLFGEVYFNFMTVKYSDSIQPQQIINQKERVMNHVKQLSPVAYTSAYLTFDKDLTMEELHEIESRYSNVSFIWAGIRTAPMSDPISNITGFGLDQNGGPVDTDKPDEEKYPAFYLLDWIFSGNTGSSKKSPWPKGYELHYTSLLKYMIDRKDVVNVLDNRSIITENYQSALDYVEEYGVKTFGILVYANAKDLIELVENESIKTLELDQVMASRRYIN